MTQGKYNKLKRYLQLDQLLREPNGYTIKELLCKIEDEITPRQLKGDLESFENEFGAKFSYNHYRGKERLWRYVDTCFSIFHTVNNEMEILSQSIVKLQELTHEVKDPRLIMLRFSLLQMKNSLLEIGTPIISLQSNFDVTGLEHLEVLGDAILHKYPVRLTYKPFNKPEFSDNVHPYHLRQSNNRWVMFGWSEGKECIMNYPLDRIQSLKHLSKDYKPTDVNFEEYFDDIVGTTNWANRDVENVILRVSKKSLDYIMTKPLHWSQARLNETETDSTIDIRLRVKLNTELEMLILSYGDAIEVLHPAELRENIKQKINKLYSKYEV